MLQGGSQFVGRLFCSPALRDPRGMKVAPCRIPLRPSGTFPKIVEGRAVGLPTEGREHPFLDMLKHVKMRNALFLLLC